jgi:putative ABC transport system permease protein
LGAGRARIVRQLVTESCVLGFAGGLGGFALAALASQILPAFAPMTIPRLAASRADWTVFAFACAVSLLSGLAFGILPALSIARHDPAVTLREAATRGSVGTSRNGLRSALVIGEVAIAVILVVVGGTLTGGFIKLLRTDPGFDADHLLASIIIAKGDQYANRENQGLLFRRILDSVRALPGVTSAGTIDALPFSGENHGAMIALDETMTVQAAEVDRVSADYLQTMGVRLLDGRFFREDDMAATRDTAIVNDVAARNLWPGQSAVGKRFCLFCRNDLTRQWKRVVGVVTSIHHATLEEPAGLQVYYAAAAPQSAQFLVVRTDSPSAALAKSIQRAVAAVDPRQPVFLSASMATLIGDSVADRRFILTLLAITGGLALLLAAAGVYGVVSYTTSLRTPEIGVRMALGAAPRHVKALIFRQGMLLASAGVLLGLAASLASARLLGSMLAGLASNDPLLITIAVLLVAVTAAVACLIPARRATRIDPVRALHEE